MSYIHRSLSLLVLLALPTSSVAAEKYALLIGIAQYEHAELNRVPLQFPKADAVGVSDLLEQSGYTVDLLLGKDATKEAIELALAKCSNEGNADGIVLIGLFGHGVQYGSDAYFAPSNSSLREAKDLQGQVLRDREGKIRRELDPESMIKLRSVLDAFARSPAKDHVLLADVGREQPHAARGFSELGSSLRAEIMATQTAVLFACSAHEQSFEHKNWGHSAFAKALLDEARLLADAGPVYAGTLADRTHVTVKRLVAEETNGRSNQTVQYIANGIIDLRLQNNSP